MSSEPRTRFYFFQSRPFTHPLNSPLFDPDHPYEFPLSSIPLNEETYLQPPFPIGQETSVMSSPTLHSSSEYNGIVDIMETSDSSTPYYEPLGESFSEPLPQPPLNLQSYEDSFNPLGEIFSARSRVSDPMETEEDPSEDSSWENFDGSSSTPFYSADDD